MNLCINDIESFLKGYKYLELLEIQSFRSYIYNYFEYGSSSLSDDLFTIDSAISNYNYICGLYYDDRIIDPIDDYESMWCDVCGGTACNC